MTNIPPAEIGMAESEVDTPALLVDLDVFQDNLAHMACQIKGDEVRFRPHAKTHKCPEIALRQIELGAIGVCCQKVGEAEAMVAGGVGDVLVSNQVVGSSKLERLAKLAGEARIGVCVDNAENIKDLGRAVDNAKTTLGVLVEIDVGARRCGVEPGQQALDLARLVADTPGLQFEGLQAYHGPAQHLREYAQRQEAIQSAANLARETQELLLANGLPCQTIAGAGTGTYPFELASGVYNELQAGSYIFMDADYGRNLGVDGKPWREYRQSLFVLATVMSAPVPERAVLDAGLKALSVDSGLPLVANRNPEHPGEEPHITFSGASDEHGTLQLEALAKPLRVGEKIRVIPGHCDPTVNLYDWLVGVRDGRVEELWPITARGASR